MSNWLLLTSRGDKHRALVRLDSVQFIREGYYNNTSIAFGGEEGFVGFAESFDAVVEAIRDQPVNKGERIIEVEDKANVESYDPDDLDCIDCRYDDIPDGGSPCNRCKKGISMRNPEYKDAPVLWVAKEDKRW